MERNFRIGNLTYASKSKSNKSKGPNKLVQGGKIYQKE